MSPTHYAAIALGIVILIFLIFSILKGIFKMIFLIIAIISSIACWIFIQRSGMPLLSFIIPSPSMWMVECASYAGALFVFLVFFHGLKWFSNLFSFNKKASSGSIITSALMFCIMLWVCYIGFSYASNLSLIHYYHDLSQANLTKQQSPSMPHLVLVKKKLLDSNTFSWLQNIDPLDDPAQTHLAALVAYCCSQPEEEWMKYYNSRLEQSSINYPSRFKNLFSDIGLRTLVEQENFSALLENELLQSFLQQGNSSSFLKDNF